MQPQTTTLASSAIGTAAQPAVAAAPLRILLLCHFVPESAGTILDHIYGFPRFSQHEYYVLSNLGDLPPWLELERFDCLMIHYSLVASYDNYISPDARRRIREFRGLKLAFVQDDYRWINDTVDAFAYMRINALFPLVGPEIMDAVYSPDRLPGVRRETVLTGYVSDALVRREVRPLAERPIDIGYRARKLPAWMGSHTLQKWQISDRVQADAAKYGLKVDVSYREEDRIYGEDWTQFILNCKAVLGTESGTSVCDFTGDIQRAVEAHVRRDPAASFETLRELYFKDEDGRIMMNVISPRCFEAAALRTLMILYEGYYSGVLTPWRHFVPLRTDHSNMDEVVEVLRDPVRSQEIVDRAYREIALNPDFGFGGLVAQVDRVIADEYRPAMAGTLPAYSRKNLEWRADFEQARRRSPFHDLTPYVSIACDAAAADAAALRDVLQDRPDKRAVVSRPDVLPPHHVDLRFAFRFRVSRIDIVWGYPDAAAAEGEIRFFTGPRELGVVEFRTSEPTDFLSINIPTSIPAADWFRVTFNRYHTGTQLHLFDIRVASDRLPLRERIRRTRRRYGVFVLNRCLIPLWLRLPMEHRLALKRHVRGAFRSVFGRDCGLS